jgi:hypothetical protein
VPGVLVVRTVVPMGFVLDPPGRADLRVFWVPDFDGSL